MIAMTRTSLLRAYQALVGLLVVCLGIAVCLFMDQRSSTTDPLQYSPVGMKGVTHHSSIVGMGSDDIIYWPVEGAYRGDIGYISTVANSSIFWYDLAPPSALGPIAYVATSSRAWPEGSTGRGVHHVRCPLDPCTCSEILDSLYSQRFVPDAR